jgi:isopenicillin N synthase-like dioxygenase
MPNLDALRVDRANLPVIDIAALRDTSPETRNEAVANLRKACLDSGFFYISNHGIADALVDDIFSAARSFFALSEADKNALDITKSPCRHGYEPLKRQTLEVGAPADLKEGYYIGSEVGSNAKFTGPNLWPSSLPEFRATMETYYREMRSLAESLMQGIASSLSLEADYFTDFCREPYARLRLLHYPPQPENAGENEKGAGAHTDFGGLTILLQDSCGGLQVLDRKNRSWIHADPIPATFVVNLGDMMARWTNDRYQSTLHRVVNTSGRERYSIPFFFHGNLDYSVACIPTCLAAGERPAYDGTTVASHFVEKMGQSYATA